MATRYDNTHVRINSSDCGGWCITATVDGYTRTYWLGLNPYYSDAIQLNETWKFTGLAVSVSVSASGPGASFSGKGDQVTFGSGWVNTAGWSWRLVNKYSGVQGKSYAALWRVDDTATGPHRFGYAIVTATANGGSAFH